MTEVVNIGKKMNESWFYEKRSYFTIRKLILFQAPQTIHSEYNHFSQKNDSVILEPKVKPRSDRGQVEVKVDFKGVKSYKFLSRSKTTESR